MVGRCTASFHNEDMHVYRIVDRRYQNDLSGTGAKLYGGRWNKIDQPVLYTTSNVSLACLELLVNVDLRFKTPNYMLLTIVVPNDCSTRQITNKDLPKNWRSKDSYSRTKEIGSNWFQEQLESALMVPSAVIPRETNYIFNIYHPTFKNVKIAKAEPFIFDNRLLK